MKKTISFKSRYGWISASEKNNKILSVSFVKSNNKGQSVLLKKLKKNTLAVRLKDRMQDFGIVSAVVFNIDKRTNIKSTCNT